MTEKEAIEGKAAFDRVQPALTVRQIFALAAKRAEKTGDEAQASSCDPEPPKRR